MEPTDHTRPEAAQHPGSEPADEAGLGRAKTLEAARRWLAARDDEVYFAPISVKKERGAREAHRLHLPASEPIVALYDSTLFGGADDGFAVTPRRLCWKNLLENPQMMPWHGLDMQSLQVEGSQVRLLGGRIECISEARAAALHGLMRELGVEAQVQHKPPRSALQGGGIEELVRTHLGVRNELFFAPGIPERKERNVRRLFAIGAGERLVAVYDNTVFGGATAGFAFTDRRLCWKEDFEAPRSLPWSQVKPGTIRVLSATAGAVEVNGTRLVLLDTDREAICRQLVELVEAASQTGEYYR